MWLVFMMQMNVLSYVISYSSSIPAIILIGGAALGQGVMVWTLYNTKSFSLLPPTVLVILFSFASVWQVPNRFFTYHNHTRWTGPWDNPNTFGLLMGTSAIIALGLGISSWLMANIKSEIGVTCWKIGVVERTTVGIRRLGLSRCAFLCLCLVSVVLMGRGLLYSYSRGAWLGTVCGLMYLFGFKLQSIMFSSNGSWNYWLWKNRLQLCVILASVCTLSFWHFRETGWQPAHRVLSAVNPVDFSWRNRVAAWEGALQITAVHPWTGAGWERPELLYEQYYLSPKIDENAAIEMNDYLMLGATLGIPALFCFGICLWQSLTHPLETILQPIVEGSVEEITDWIGIACRAGTIVLLVGFWFDGGMFKLPTAATFWILLELGAL